MTKTTYVMKTAIVSAFLGASMIAAPALAASNKDVQKCRAAFSENGDLDMTQYRLRFESEEGKRTKTIYFKAISHDGENSLDVSCTLKRAKVIALNAGKGDVTLMTENTQK